MDMFLEYDAFTSNGNILREKAIKFNKTWNEAILCSNKFRENELGTQKIL